MNERDKQLKDALASVTKIEIEPLPRGRFRWSLYRDGERTFMAESITCRREIEVAVEATVLIIEGAAIAQAEQN